MAPLTNAMQIEVVVKGRREGEKENSGSLMSGFLAVEIN